MKKPFVRYAPKSSNDIKWDKKPKPKLPGEPTPGHGKVPNKTKMPGDDSQTNPKPFPAPIRGKVGSAVRQNETDEARISRLQNKMMSRAQGPARDQLRRRIAALKKRSPMMEK